MHEDDPKKTSKWLSNDLKMNFSALERPHAYQNVILFRATSELNLKFWKLNLSKSQLNQEIGELRVHVQISKSGSELGCAT